MPKKPGSTADHAALRPSASRRALASTTVLAILLILISVSAGALGSRAWRASIHDQAEREFRRQAGAVDAQVRAHLDGMGALFTLAADTSRTGKALGPVLSRQDTIKQYPGVIAVGHAVGSPSGTVSFTDEYSTVSAFGIVDLRLRSMVGPEMRAAIRQATATGRRVASVRYNMHWFTSQAEPAFFLVQPDVPGQPAAGWTVALVYGNWVLQDSLQSAGSSFRAELLDGETILSGDYLPIGSQATKPPPPIGPDATRSVTTIDSLGRPLDLVVADADGVTRAHIGSQPTMLLLGVSLLGLLSGLLVWVLGRGRTRALRMVAEATAQLRHQAFHDSLTGLANRALLADRLAAALTEPTRTDGGVAVLLCDLDDFKTVNDTLGHAAGDELLVQVAERLSASARAGDLVARLGGDEFAVLLEAPAGEPEARAVAERILRALREPLRVAGRSVVARSSVGIALSGTGTGTDVSDPERLLRESDVAMYAAKREGKARYAVFTPDLEQQRTEQLPPPAAAPILPRNAPEAGLPTT